MARDQGSTSRNIRRARRLRTNLTSPSLKGVVNVRWWFVGIMLWMYLVVQLPFGLLMLIGYGGERAGENFFGGTGAYFIPGQELFAWGWIMAAFVAVTAMVVALFALKHNPVWRNSHLGTYLLCYAFSFAPFLCILPWALIWVGFRSFSVQKTAE